MHIELIKIRPLFPVNLNIDEKFVHGPGHIFIFEGLLFHDVTPVAGRIADTQEDGFVLFPGTGEGFFSPGIPVHRVPGML
jgi:hypothetical protein